MNKNELKSVLDDSVNFTTKQDEGFLEARYVRRTEDYFITYLSSHNGCNKNCHFCHLTATNQKYMNSASYEDFMNQAKEVFSHYIKQNKARAVNFNFMARGEPLSNKLILENPRKLLLGLTELSEEHNLIPKFNISTIMPNEVRDISLSSLFKGITPTLYYSIYSMNKVFRKKWVPAGIDPLLALDKLMEYQADNAKIIKIHYAFIENENDSINDLEQIMNEIEKRKLLIDWNIVRYNPFSELQGKEPSDLIIQRNVDYLGKHVNGNLKVVSRIGFDVKASCGMFVK